MHSCLVPERPYGSSQECMKSSQDIGEEEMEKEHRMEPVQFSLSHVRLFATPWTAACQASLSITNSQSLLKLMSIELVPSNHLILCHLLLLLPSVFPSIRVFSYESVLCIRWPKYWSFSFTQIICLKNSNNNIGLGGISVVIDINYLA